MQTCAGKAWRRLLPVQTTVVSTPILEEPSDGRKPNPKKKITAGNRGRGCGAQVALGANALTASSTEEQVAGPDVIKG